MSLIGYFSSHHPSGYFQREICVSLIRKAIPVVLKVSFFIFLTDFSTLIFSKPTPSLKYYVWSRFNIIPEVLKHLCLIFSFVLYSSPSWLIFQREVCGCSLFKIIPVVPNLPYNLYSSHFFNWMRNMHLIVLESNSSGSQNFTSSYFLMPVYHRSMSR